MFSFLKPYILYIKVGTVLIVFAALAYFYMEASHYKSADAVLTLQLSQAQDANKSNQATISGLIAERDRAGQTCESRLSAKDDLIHRLQERDKLKGGNNAKGTVVSDGKTGRVGGDNSGPSNSGDNLLDALNLMYPGTAGSQGNLCQATGASEPAGTGVVPRKICFCSDDDAINLLKNFDLGRSDSKDLRLMLDGLR